ncbi:alpha/beta hydrolase [Parapusillimonas sp. SGNA-6]|nr:alpha/beta hydrolase [Parapusillimonas sp. SGNA-6]
MPSTPTFPRYTATVEQTPIHYTQAGNGPLLLLIHGSLCDYRYWRWQLPALSRQYTVVAPSLPGYWPEALQREDPSFTVARHSAAMLAFIQQIGDGEAVHVLGHSRGAHVALNMALEAPTLMRSLTLADPGFGFTGEPGSTPVHTEAVALLARDDVEQALSLFVDTVNGPGTWRQMVGWFKEMVRDNARTLLSQVNEPHAAVDARSLTGLDMNTLLIGGANSPARYRSRIDTLAQVWPHARRLTIPLASHGMNLANPKAFNDGLLDYLNSVGARTTE